jgi:hypothetical protein
MTDCVKYQIPNYTESRLPKYKTERQAQTMPDCTGTYVSRLASSLSKTLTKHLHPYPSLQSQNQLSLLHMYLIFLCCHVRYVQSLQHTCTLEWTCHNLGPPKRHLYHAYIQIHVSSRHVVRQSRRQRASSIPDRTVSRHTANTHTTYHTLPRHNMATARANAHDNQLVRRQDRLLTHTYNIPYSITSQHGDCAQQTTRTKITIIIYQTTRRRNMASRKTANTHTILKIHVSTYLHAAFFRRDWIN